ncbi:hypothetical protein M9458_039814, partial [Cirrhinus mrigala]
VNTSSSSRMRGTWRTTWRSLAASATVPSAMTSAGFRCGLDDDLRFIMPRGDPCWTPQSYISFTLWTNGSTFTVGEAEEDSNLVQPHLADVSQHDSEPSQPPPRLAEPEPEPTTDGEPEPKATEPSPKGATAHWNATEPEPSPSNQVREPATWPVTVDVPVGREGAEDSTAAESEQCMDLGHFDIELDLIDFTEDIYVERDLIDFYGNTFEDMPSLPPSSELSACLDFPPSLPLLSPSIIPAAVVSPPLSPDSPAAHPQSTICAVGSPRVCQSPSVSWLEDPSSPPPASESWTLTRPSVSFYTQT